MALKRLALPVVLNATAAGAGVLGTTLIVWNFGLANYGTYVVALAKLSLITLGVDLLPGSYAQFRLQDDPKFAESASAFYILFGLVAAGIAAALMSAGAIAGSSWFMLVYVFGVSFQRWVDGQLLASGDVGASVSILLVSNLVRAMALGLLILVPILSVPDTLWASLAAGWLAAQVSVIVRRPGLVRSLLGTQLGESLRYLWGLRGDYPPYYANSVLKRAKETLFPLFCDIALPSKTELGRLLVYTRSLEAVAGQIRIFELFLIHRQTRANLARRRKRILIGSALLGHIGVILLASFLLLNHGLTASSVLYAAMIGLFLYPYVLELARRSDAYAALQPRRVTISLIVFLTTLATSLGLAWALDLLVIPVLLVCILLAQSASAGVYLLQERARGRKRRRLLSQGE